MLNGNSPTYEEIAEATGLTPRSVENVINATKSEPISLDAPIGNDEESVLGDLLENKNSPNPYREAATDNIRIDLEKVISTLTAKEQEVIRMRRGLRPYPRDYTLEEVGKKFGVTRERIRQIEVIAMKKLRKKAKHLQNYY